MIHPRYRLPHTRRMLRAAVALALASLLPVLVAGCVTITAEPRALLEHDDGRVEIQTPACAAAVTLGDAAHAAVAPAGLDPRAIRLLTWNIHKEGDPGWQRDLASFGAANDILLLQEAVLRDALRRPIDAAGLRWVMASSFFYRDIDIGVLTAARVAPVASCTLRVVEPLLRLPKSSVITWFPIEGRTQTLAVVNIHAINFSLSLRAYRAQFEAIAAALAGHDGPVILAGDLNTWTDQRAEVVRDVARRLGLSEVAFADDRRRRFFGHELDHILTRQMTLLGSSTTAVTSSDHNPVAATLSVVR